MCLGGAEHVLGLKTSGGIPWCGEERGDDALCCHCLFVQMIQECFFFLSKTALVRKWWIWFLAAVLRISTFFVGHQHAEEND